ncbi:uncharacterized protein LOC113217050 [Frankliniella occidentalis]|uniref:Uncharacterized protein LOC113217050 n=1 Tax=Frankliniella occidentalis TaxID=133901 RepID=A0A6J1TIU5_FRAOC|nr:uncharacterized protein LOC113217050 [Frankliniella occidentalis]
MARASYCLLLYLFEGQFSLTRYEKTGVERVCLFVVKIYIHHWFTCQIARWAPRNDLELLGSLRAYAEFDPQVADKGLKAVGRHLWYLSEEIVGLAFFDEIVSADTKIKMVHSMKTNKGSNIPPHRLSVTGSALKALAYRGLEDLVTTSTMNFFKKAKLPTDFLEKPPLEWESDPSYKECLAVVRNLKVVNDTAERGVGLIKEYTAAGLTKDEEQLQSILKIVKNHRACYPKLTKSELV